MALNRGAKELVACNFYSNCFERACEHHPTSVSELSSEAVVTTLNEDSSDSYLFSACQTVIRSLWF